MVTISHALCCNHGSGFLALNSDEKYIRGKITRGILFLIKSVNFEGNDRVNNNKLQHL